MAIRVNNSLAVPVIEIEGKFLGSLQGPDFQEVLGTMKESGTVNVVVDLSKTDFIDSSGIGVLIGGLTSMRNANGDIRLSAMHQRIKSVFLMTKLLGPVFENYENAEAAASSYTTSAAETA